MLLSFCLHFSSFHSLHISVLTGDRKRKRKENDEEKKTITSSRFFSPSNHKYYPLYDSKRKCRDRQRQQKIAFDGLIFPSSDSRKTLGEYLLTCSHSISPTSFFNIFFYKAQEKVVDYYYRR